jgi:hypothetical protein
MSSTVFDLSIYFLEMESKIDSILYRPQSKNTTYDILDTEVDNKVKLLILKTKQKQMKIGFIWQEILGNYNEFENLGNGHSTGLDIISRSRKIIIELKNRTNTDNSSSRKTNLNKLSLYKKQNPEYMCVYGTINDNTKQKTNNGYIRTIIHNEYEIKEYMGMCLLRLILGDNTEIIIDFLRNKLN